METLSKTLLVVNLSLNTLKAATRALKMLPTRANVAVKSELSE